MHVVTVYEKIKEFDCLISNTNFSHKSTLNKHIAVIHNGKTPSKSKSNIITKKGKGNQMVCSKCKKIIPKKIPLAVHEAVLHSMIVVLSDVMARIKSRTMGSASKFSVP